MDYNTHKEYVENFTLPDGSTYNGECIVRDGMIELSGTGEVLYTNGDIYKGDFEHGFPRGWGMYKFKNGHSYKGFYDNYPQGLGYLNEDYSMSLGQFSQGRLNGWAIRYHNNIFKFAYLKNGRLIKDETSKTLWVRREITSLLSKYKGNLIQISKEHDYIRFGIPEIFAIPKMAGIPDDKRPKWPAYGFEFFADGSVKMGEIKNHKSGTYILCHPDGSMEIGKWKDDVKVSDLTMEDIQKPVHEYDEMGINVY